MSEYLEESRKKVDSLKRSLSSEAFFLDGANTWPSGKPGQSVWDAWTGEGGVLEKWVQYGTDARSSVKERFMSRFEQVRGHVDAMRQAAGSMHGSSMGEGKKAKVAEAEVTNQNNLLVSRCLPTHSVHYILDHEKGAENTPLFPRRHITCVTFSGMTLVLQQSNVLDPSHSPAAARFCQPEPQAVCRRLESRIPRFSTARCRLFNVMDEGEWEHILARDGVNVYRRPMLDANGQGSKFYCIKAVSTINAKAVDVYELLKDPDRVREYNDECAEAEVGPNSHSEA